MSDAAEIETENTGKSVPHRIVHWLFGRFKSGRGERHVILCDGFSTNYEHTENVRVGKRLVKYKKKKTSAKINEFDE